MMSKLLPAVYEGNRIIKLTQEPEGFQEHQPIVVMVMPVPAEATFVVEDVGFEGLRQFLVANEQRFGMTSVEFFDRFSRGEMGDVPDHILWSGAYEIYRRLAPKNEQSSPRMG
jgi:hypothetical protein